MLSLQTPGKQKSRTMPCFILTHLKLLLDLFLRQIVLPPEPLNPSTRINELLPLSCIEWVALGTDFHSKVLPGGTSFKTSTTGTGNCCLIVWWMNLLLHGLSPLSPFGTIMFKYAIYTP